jgi:SAM-dependent methyltransferase
MTTGTHESLAYFICSGCGALQIEEPVDDVSSFYDNDTYSSFRDVDVGPIRKRLATIRNRFALTGGGGWVGRLLNRKYPLTRAHYVLARYADRMDLNILDIGCGNGKFLELLSGVGFTRLTGIDPFIAHDVEGPHYSIQKRYLSQVTAHYDIIWLHHSFEHVKDPHRDLADIRERLTQRGVCLITVPILGCVFEEFGADSYIIQAPHHNFLFTVKSMGILSAKASLVMEAHHQDAFGISNWLKLSALWRRNISCAEMRGDMNGYLSASDLTRFNGIERELLSAGLGDNVTFVLRKSS